MKKLALCCVFLLPQAHAQVDAKGEWQFPTSIRTLCIDTEQAIVASFKAMIVQNRLADAAKNEDKRQYLEMANAIKDSQIKHEQSWDRLGCASILYPRK